MKTFTHKERSEVDIRVTQELKNHQDFVYQTNQSLQNLNTSLISVSLLHEKAKSQLFNQKKELEIDFENLKETVTKQLSEFLQRMGNLETKCSQIAEQLEESLEEFSADYMTKEAYVNAFYPTVQKLQELDKREEQKHSYIESEIFRFKSLLNDQVESVRKEIPSIEEFKPIRKEMEQRFQTFKVDFNGLSREIVLLKKAVDYDQKKFENVYTLIERLKAGKE